MVNLHYLLIHLHFPLHSLIINNTNILNSKRLFIHFTKEKDYGL